ncbi:hypothetical protein BC829DRAFT_177408 [Chytridium lagenaria]|nr:hypothetical protein BC829DRAFT_177408 [Chytridium lagenaria]
MTAEAQIQSCHPHPKSPSSLSDNSQRRFSVRKSLGLLLKRESSRSSLKDDAESPTSPMSPVILTTPRTAATTPPNIILRSPQKGKRKKSAEGNRPWTSGLPQASLAEKRKPFFLQTGTLGLRNFRQRSSNSIPLGSHLCSYLKLMHLWIFCVDHNPVLEDPISNDHATIVLADGHQGVGSQPHPLSDPEDRERLRSRSAPIVSSPQFLPTKPAMRSSKPLPKPPINVPVRTCSSPLSDNDGSSYVAALGHIAPLGPHRAGTPNSFNSLLERYMDPSPQEIEAALKEVEQAPAVDDNSEESIRRIDEARRSVTSTELNVPSLPPSARRIKRMGVLFGEDGTREEFTEAEADELDVKEKILTPKGSLPPVPRPSSSWTNAFRSSTTKPLPLSPSSNSDAVPALKKRPSSFRLWRDDAPAGNSWSRSAVPAFSSDMGVPELPYVDPKVEIGTTELHHINGLRERSASSPSVPSKTGVKNNAAAQWDAAESAAESRRLTAIDVAKADLITPCVTAGVDALALSRSEKIAAMKADGVHCKKVEVKVSISERNSDMGVESSTEVVSVTVDAPCSAVVKKAEVHQLRQPVEGKSETGTSTSAVENSRKTNSEMIQPVIGDVGTKPRRPSLIDRLFNMTKKRSSRNLSKEAESGGWRIDVGRIISNRKEPSNSEDICTNSPAAPSSTIASSFSPTGPTSPLSIVTSEAPLPALPTAEPTSPASPRPRRSLSVPFHLRRLSIVSNPDSSSDVDVTGYRKRSQTVSNPLSTRSSSLMCLHHPPPILVLRKQPAQRDAVFMRACKEDGSSPLEVVGLGVLELPRHGFGRVHRFSRFVQGRLLHRLSRPQTRQIFCHSRLNGKMKYALKHALRLEDLGDW